MSGAPPRPGASFALLLPLLLAAQPVATDSYLPALPAIGASIESLPADARGLAFLEVDGAADIQAIAAPAAVES